MPDPRHDLGGRAEAAVAAWLERDGWIVLDHRWRVPQGELDLVRARRTARSGTPLESVDRRHLGRLRAALGRYAAVSRSTHAGLRLDLVTVTPATDGRWRLERYPSIDAW
jgi:putative endonuclease